MYSLLANSAALFCTFSHRRLQFKLMDATVSITDCSYCFLILFTERLYETVPSATIRRTGTQRISLYPILLFPFLLFTVFPPSFFAPGAGILIPSKDNFGTLIFFAASFTFVIFSFTAALFPFFPMFFAMVFPPYLPAMLHASVYNILTQALPCFDEQITDAR